MLSGPGSVAAIVTGQAVAGAAGLHQARGGGPGHLTAVSPTGGGPDSAYDCDFNLDTDAFTGADGTASEIGWEGNHQGVVTCLGGTFLVQDGINRDYGFGIYDGAPTTWTDADGYLPAQTTTFRHTGAIVSITEFADKVVLGGDAYVAVYSRVAVSNPTNRVLVENPEASPGMVLLHPAPDAVGPHARVVHDYVVAADRFGNQYPWPSAPALAGAGGFDKHFAHMQSFWNRQLAAIAEIDVPDSSLDDAYRSGFIYTQIARSGSDLDTGVNGYESEFSHDVVGILTTLFTQGYFADAHGLLLEARNVMGAQGQYDDGIWTYSLPWAIYLMKTGDVGFVKENFAAEGPLGAAQPSIEDTAHEIASGRTGPSGIMAATDDIDTEGSWTTDDFQALLGLAAYHYLAVRVGDAAEATWATQQYDSLLAATNDALYSTIIQFHLDYLPCSILQPNTANRCADPEDANWTSPLGDWAWEGGLLGATVDGLGLSLIDATYRYGFGRLVGMLPPNTTGGFPDDYYSSGYNAAEGTAGLAGSDYRDQGILNYEFMIANSQSGPYSWWESSAAPSTDTPWIGRHPGAGQGSSPHAWGMAGANMVLLDSLVAQAADGDLIVGRGVPAGWVGGGPPVSVTDFPTTGGRRLDLTISSSSAQHSVSLVLGGQLPSGQVLFQLPSFVDDIASTSTGTVDQATGTVALAPGVSSVTVRLRRAPAHG
jgi:hypothetical protein